LENKETPFKKIDVNSEKKFILKTPSTKNKLKAFTSELSKTPLEVKKIQGYFDHLQTRSQNLNSEDNTFMKYLS
jgi:hypothetical protein